MKPLRLAFGSLIFVLAASACADEAFTVQYAAGYVRAPANVSFFGVYQDGRVNADAWDQFGVRMSRSFAGAPCEVLYSNDFSAQKPELAGAIDSIARADGISDQLLDKLSPMAKGDLIVVLAISGHPPKLLGGSDAGAAPPPPPPARYGGRRGRRSGGVAASEPQTDQNVFELAATMYSVKTKQSVAVVAMSYTGSSVEDALQKFTAKLSAETTGSRCVGWSLDQPVDPDAIRNLPSE